MGKVFNFNEFPIIETENLRLREMTKEDIASILKNFGNPDVVKYLSMKPLESIEQAEQWFRWMGDFFISKDGIRWGVTLRKSPETVIGSAGLHGWNRESHYAEIGYDIGKSYWGNGYGTEIVRGLIRFGWHHMNLHRLEADVLEGNDASMHILKKFGFQQEGIFRERAFKDGKFLNVYQFGLLRSESDLDEPTS